MPDQYLTLSDYLLKKEAYYIFNTALCQGTIKRPVNCEVCGKADYRIEGHHNDYREPLKVHWLCYPCHDYVHRLIDRVRKGTFGGKIWITEEEYQQFISVKTG